MLYIFSELYNNENNKIQSKILLSTEVIENNKNTIFLKPLKFINSDLLEKNVLKRVNNNGLNFRIKHEIKDPLLNYIETQFDNAKVFEANDFDSLKDNRDEIIKVQESKPIKPEYIARYNNRQPVKSINTHVSYNTNSSLKKTVMDNNNYKCEIDGNHKSFISYKNVSYMEGHHLIPMSYQDKISINIDHIDNIVCLCPNCHREIHYGKNQKKLIEQLYEKRKNTVLFKNINISLNDLYEIYNPKNNNVDE